MAGATVPTVVYKAHIDLVTDSQHSVRGLMVQHPVGGGGNYSTHRRFVSQPLRSLIGFASIGIAAIIRRETHTPTPPLTP
ncbi:DEHA2C12958p [Debaryomyces hansenii CBS767]|uniref:DEHA2C12958p n=1 Tax=Debaryomyces hansenii (strain ATCC 36239 / CBS 767 / BCRC 21394 / JCM 1990 / NBRC 0083 / IGC 2968) TaxID=284592 RepID=Q6BU80_DEBHA|nr:DEHA2C12958p [Debaryomyces hansenii CBS767]CAG86315.2 DEHA2C12958p [Debaryomyces hansenii CBS767]|eukprot:XP_458239.2 DEHA2C12958p [Debaryomyces hansenii CBS767]